MLFELLYFETIDILDTFVTCRIAVPQNFQVSSLKSVQENLGLLLL
jgi:hypothetical protein